MATVKVVRRPMTSLTGSAVGPRKARDPIELTLPEGGSIDIRRAENGLIVSAWGPKDLDRRTYVISSLADLKLK